jgi:hypothetical protein
MSVAAFTAWVVARHRVRRRPRPSPSLVFARRPRSTPAASPARARLAGPPAASLRLQLLLAPRISMTFGVSRRNDPTGVPEPSTPPQVREARIAARQLERVIEHAGTLAVRHERVAVVPAVAFGHRLPGPNAPAAAMPPQLVLAHTSARVPAPADSPAPPPVRQPAQGPIAWAPAAHEIERLADRVLSSIDRRFVAERERRGAV